MAKRKPQRRAREVATEAYRDPEGNVLTLRQTLSPGTVAKLREASHRDATTLEDSWRRRTEMLFERLTVSWEIAGLPLTDQRMLLGRYRMADAQTQAWVRETLTAHVERYLPDLAERWPRPQPQPQPRPPPRLPPNVPE